MITFVPGCWYAGLWFAEVPEFHVGEDWQKQATWLASAWCEGERAPRKPVVWRIRYRFRYSATEVSWYEFVTPKQRLSQVEATVASVMGALAFVSGQPIETAYWRVHGNHRVYAKRLTETPPPFMDVSSTDVNDRTISHWEQMVKDDSCFDPVALKMKNQRN